MRANASKEASPAPTSASSALHRLNEKVPTPSKTTQSSSLHHSADRLHRIEAEAHVALASDSPSSAQQEHTRNRAPRTGHSLRRQVLAQVSMGAAHLPSRQHRSSTTPTWPSLCTPARPRVADQHIFNTRIPDEGWPDRETKSPPVGAGLFAPDELCPARGHQAV